MPAFLLNSTLAPGPAGSSAYFQVSEASKLESGEASNASLMWLSACLPYIHAAPLDLYGNPLFLEREELYADVTARTQPVPKGKLACAEGKSVYPTCTP